MNVRFRASMSGALIGAASFALILAPAIAADAAPIVTYGFEASTDTLRRNPSSISAGVTASPIANGAGMVSADTLFREAPPVDGPGDFGIFQRGTGFGAVPGANTEAEAVAENVYWSFTVTPNPGQTISGAELTFDTLYYNGNANATVFVRSSVDDFASTLGGVGFATDTPNRTPRHIALSAAHQGLTEPLTFRFYMYAPEGLSSGLTGGLDNIALHVPEPATSGLLSLGALLALRRARRRAA